MEKIIQKLYEVHIKDSYYPYGEPDQEEMKKEYALYGDLLDRLSEKDSKDFSKYANLQEERHAKERAAVYEYGFKAAIKLIVESLSVD